MTLIKELIDIPERVHQGDFVLKLAEGVSQPEQTLRNYVVTPQLADAFANALSFIAEAVRSGSSKAAYLHGSFGAGKSHFMAVLDLILAGNLRARSIPELAEGIARHESLRGRKFLMVPYHMIGAQDMESALLGQYAEFVHTQHPQAPVPGFYLAEGLFRDARQLRERMGDEAFFAKLNSSAQGEGWGKLEAGWDAERFDSAQLEAPHGEERARLVGDLIRTYFSAYQSLAVDAEAYVPLDEGLSILSRHARDLGYDAVILFLDELVLWLASRAADAAFVSREGTKLVKLVEATHTDRPVPLVSFVARQRDLRELVGESVAGSIQVQFSDVLKHWEARFHRITLEDRNLPAIAEKRVLRPVSEAARQQLQSAFDEVLKARRDVLDTLLTTEADREMFRKVYPFSPALVQTLIAVSSALQRERTALKLMMQLLVDRREDLALGALIPVGDLWDVIVEGDEPFSDDMRLRFTQARRLYSQRLLPMLEQRHGVTWEALRLGQVETAAATALRNDARLLKTLLLAALVPQVESLHALTAQRLVALNHGTFRSPIPGREVQDVIRRLRDWAGEIGELKISDDNNPTVSLQVTGVDIEPVVQAARMLDNTGNRLRKLRELLFEQLGLKDDGGLFAQHMCLWRGTQREVELLFGNVEDMSADQLRGRSGVRTVVFDYPLSDRNHSALDHLAKLREYRSGAAPTVVWVPSFLSEKSLSDLGRFVILDGILQGESFERYAAHLSYRDQVEAKALARNQLDALRVKVRGQLEVAFGISTEPREAVVGPLEPGQHLYPLDDTFEPNLPVAANLHDALDDLVGQLLQHQYPDHPEFETEIKAAQIRKIWPEVSRTLEASDRRSFVGDQALRRIIRAVVTPCRLGQMSETHLLIEPYWQEHFNRCQAADGGSVTVAKLRQWMDQPNARGLPEELQNLIILTYAGLTNRGFLRNGVSFEPSVDAMPNDLELREQALPDPQAWQVALTRAAGLFGLTLPQTLSAAHVARLVSEVRAAVAKKRDAIGALVQVLRVHTPRYCEESSSDRLRTALSAQTLLTALQRAEEDQLVACLAQANLDTSETAVARTLGQAADLVDAMGRVRWTLFDTLKDLSNERREAGQRLMTRLGEALAADEHVIPLRNALETLSDDAAALLASGQVSAGPAAPPPSGKSSPPAMTSGVPSGVRVVEAREQSHLPTDAALALLETLEQRLRSDPSLELTVSWRLEQRS